MKTKILEQKVTSKLEKWGNNAEEVKVMVLKHFKEAASIYSSANSIAEYIRTIY